MEYACCCHNLGLCPIGHTPCVWGSSLKPGWSPAGGWSTAGSRSGHGCLLVRQARGLVGSPFWGAARILAACPGPSLLSWGFQGQPCSVLLSPTNHSFSFQKPRAWAPAFSREDRHPKKGQRQVLFCLWAALLGVSFAGKRTQPGGWFLTIPHGVGSSEQVSLRPPPPPDLARRGGGRGVGGQEREGSAWGAQAPGPPPRSVTLGPPPRSPSPSAPPTAPPLWSPCSPCLTPRTPVAPSLCRSAALGDLVRRRG